MDSVVPANPKPMQMLLEQLNFLRDMTHDEVIYILNDAVEERRFVPGEFLFAQDEPVHYVYLILEGSVEEVRTAREATGATRQTLKRKAGPGTKLGLYDFLYKHEHSTRARALESGRLLAIRATALERLIYRFPDVRGSLAPLQKIDRLRTIPFLAELDAIALGFVADITSDKLEYKPRQEIYGPGKPADPIYLLDQGQVQLKWTDGSNLFLGNGAAFGFARPGAPLHSAPPQRDNSALAVAATSVYTIPRANLIDIMGSEPERRGYQLRRLVIQTLDWLPVFHNFTPEQREKLAGFVSHYHIPNNYLIIQQAELNDSLWILLPSYRAQIHALDKTGQALLSTGAEGPNYFGENSLIAQLPAESTVEAEPNSQWLRLHWRDFQIFTQENGADLPRKLVLRTNVDRLFGAIEKRQHYSWLQEDEILDIFVRRHWIVLLRKTSPGQILLILLLMGLIVGTRLASPWYVWWLLGLGGVITLLQLTWGALDYLNDYMMVTNRRVVRQEKVLFINEWRQEAAIEQIQNVTTSQTFLAKLLGYGNVEVQTAAVRGGIRFNYVPDPDAVKSSIFAQRNTREGHARAEGKMVIQRLLAGRLGVDTHLPNRVRLAPTERDEPAAVSKWRPFSGYLRAKLNLQRTEHDRIIWRKHWIVLLSQVFVPMAILGIIVLAILAQFMPFNFPDRVRNAMQTLDVLLAFFGLADIGWLAWLITDWRNDTFEVNKKEIVDVTKSPLFLSETRRTARLTDITNVEVDIPTPLHYWLDFGHVHLETAGSEGDLTFDGVPGPREVAGEINRRIEDYRRQEQLDQAHQRAQELPDWFEMYNRLDPDREANNKMVGQRDSGTERQGDKEIGR